MCLDCHHAYSLTLISDKAKSIKCNIIQEVDKTWLLSVFHIVGVDIDMVGWGEGE